MFNPFKAQLPATMHYSPEPNVILADTNSTVHSNAVALDDGYDADVLIGPLRGDVGDIRQEGNPDYAGRYDRTLVFTPGQRRDYDFVGPIDPMPNLAGTVELNIANGPVDGNAMDTYQTGNRQQLMATPPGYYGPVVGGPDQAAAISAAYWQASFSSVSNDASTQAMIAAV